MDFMTFNFHGVGPALRTLDRGETDCWLDLGFFEAVLDLITDSPNIGITVDDGNISDFTHILPRIIKRGLRAKFFICTGRLDHPLFLSRNQVHCLLGEGMGIGSHGVSHQSWNAITPHALVEELESSRRVLEAAFGIHVDEAACPFGSYDRKVLVALRRAGYRRVYTSDGGVSRANCWLVPRMTITRQMSLDEIGRLVTTGPGGGMQLVMYAKRLIKRLR